MTGVLRVRRIDSVDSGAIRKVNSEVRFPVGEDSNGLELVRYSSVIEESANESASVGLIVLYGLAYYSHGRSVRCQYCVYIKNLWQSCVPFSLQRGGCSTICICRRGSKEQDKAHNGPRTESWRFVGVKSFR